METTPRRDTLIVAALARFSDDFEVADPELADEARKVALKFTEKQGIDPDEAVRQL